MDDSIKKTAYAGYAAKGAVYAITGILALMTALDMGGEKAGKLKVIEFLENQSFGKIILALLGIGLVCYAVWRFIQSIQDPEGIGDDGKAIIKRISFFISGLVYLGLGIFAIVDIFREPSKSGSSSGGGSSILTGETGKYIFIAVGLALAGKAIYQFIKAYKGDFLQKFQYDSLTDDKRRKLIKNTGYAGLSARGVLVGIVAFFFLKAGFNYGGGGSEQMKGTSEAFSFIHQQSYGSYLLGIVAAGLVCYGVYMIIMSRYRQFDD